jgi:hypothetical protein
MTLREAVASRDRRRSLEELADVVALTIATAEPANVAALAKQLQAVMRELAELQPEVEEADPVDDLAKKRAARRKPAAKDLAGAEAPSKQRRSRSRRAGGDGGAAS